MMVYENKNEKVFSCKSLSRVYKIKLLVEFYNKYGREPKWMEEYKGAKLGKFLNNIRIGNVKPTTEERKLLKDIGYRLDCLNKKEIVHKKVLLLVEFYKEYNRRPKSSEEYKGVKIGRFLVNIKQNRVKPTEEDRALLEKTGIRTTK